MSLQSDKDILYLKQYLNSTAIVNDGTLSQSSSTEIDGENGLISSKPSSPVAMIKQALESGSVSNFSCKKTSSTKNEKSSPLSPHLISPFQKVDLICHSLDIEIDDKDDVVFSSYNPTSSNTVDSYSDSLEEVELVPSTNLVVNSKSEDDTALVDDSKYFINEQDTSCNNCSKQFAYSEMSLNSQILECYSGIELENTQGNVIQSESDLQVNITAPKESLEFPSYSTNLKILVNNEDNSSLYEQQSLNIDDLHQDIHSQLNGDNNKRLSTIFRFENFSDHSCSELEHDISDDALHQILLSDHYSDSLSISRSFFSEQGELTEISELIEEYDANEDILSNEILESNDSYESNDDHKSCAISERSEHPEKLETHEALPHELNTAFDALSLQRSYDQLPTLSVGLKEDIERFSIEGYAAQYFSVRKKSNTLFFKKKTISLNTLMSWSKVPLTYPLTELAKKFHKDALRAFKDVQKIMGERSGVSTFGVSRVPVKEVQNLISLAINYGELRDELLCQVIKQITSNPNLRGWSLLGALCATIPPSKNLQSYLIGFLLKAINEAKETIAQSEEALCTTNRNQSTTSLKKNKALEVVLAEELSHRIAIYRAAHYSLKGVRRLCMPGITPRLKIPNSEETEHLLNMSRYESPFGEALEQQPSEVMGDDDIPSGVPKIAWYLTHAILMLGGLSTPGIFRIAGNNDQLSILRRSLECGEYRPLGEEKHSYESGGKSSLKKKKSLMENDGDRPLLINDAHVPATLLKAWLRELEVSLIPEQYYELALKAASIEILAARINAIKRIISCLPYSHRCTFEFLISFLRIIAGEDREDAVNETKMNINNLAIVFGPTILRAPATLSNGVVLDIKAALGNARLEQTFLATILSNPQQIFGYMK